MFELYYSFFRYFLLSCRYEMFQKRILSKPKLGLHKQLLGGHGPRSNGTAYVNDDPQMPDASN